MGYGTGMELKLNVENWLHVKYNGINFVPVDFEESIKSWDCVGDVHAKNNLRPDLLKYDVKIKPLTQEDRDYLKKDGWKKGDENTFDFEECPKGSFWGGYTRPAINEQGIKRTFPVELKGDIYIAGFGWTEIYVTVKPSNNKKMIDMLKDMVDYYISDEDVKEYMEEYKENEEEEISFDRAQQRLWNEQDNDFNANWKVQK